MGIAPVREFRRYIREIEREVAYQLKNQSGCCGVTLAQCHCLMELDESGATSIVDLSQRLRLDTSTLSRTVDGLVREGYVERTLNPDNRRFVTVRLTDSGTVKAGEINAVCDSFYTDLLRDYPEGQAALLEAVKRLADIMTHKRDLACCAIQGGRIR